jgi:peptide/nickel transport system substrate-binding protein
MNLRSGLTTLAILAALHVAGAQQDTQLRFCIAASPKTFDPLLVTEEASETVRYLTGGVLLRLNRQSQQVEGELASSWKVSPDGKSIRFTLRQNLRFSDGTPFSAEDVAYTIGRLNDASLHSPVADAFHAGDGKIAAQILAPDKILIRFPALIVGVNKLFDQLAIQSAHSPQKQNAVLGPYRIAEYKPGAYVLLSRNPNFWKRDSAGRRLPYIDSIRLEVEQNRDMEMLRQVRGDIDWINSLDPIHYDQLRTRAPNMAVDLGAGLDSEEIWFNQVPSAPIPAYKRAWFASASFRQAISLAIDRTDLVRVVYRGLAQPGVGPISPANRTWFNKALQPLKYDPQAALANLRGDGFNLRDGTLYDRDGHPVEFSVITNSGNKSREEMAAMIQQDLQRVGIRLNVVALDFPSLIERITRSFNYEACLLGIVNDDLDPNGQLNIWLSSADNHQWNPNQKTPATPWEAELDRLMRLQASTPDFRKRKQAVDRMQEIVQEQQPFIYLVNKESLAAVSTRLRNLAPTPLRPQLYWNVEWLWFGAPSVARK